MKVSSKSVRRVRRVIESLESRQLLAAVPTLVKDVNTQPDLSFEPQRLFSTGSVAYFTQLDATLGYELWRTDGTPAGTVLVKDINPGKAGSYPRDFVQFGTNVYFSAITETAGAELWKTDGTAAGTVMVTDAVPGIGSSYPNNIRVAGSTLFFFATTPATGYEVWKSDGTTAGTSLIVDLRPGVIGQNQTFAPTKIATAGSIYLYNAFDGTNSGVFRTDGTAAGTYLLQSINLYSMQSAGARAIFTAGSGGTFYSTDGTTAAPFGDAYRPTLIKVVGTNVFYFGYTSGVGYTLFKKSATGSTATQLTLPVGVSTPGDLLAFGSTFVFTAQTTTTGTNLYQATSTGVGATLLKDFTAFDNSIFAPTVIGSTFYFINDATQELWKSDGTSGGTSAVVAVNNLVESFDDPVKMVAVGTRLVLENYSVMTGYELWSCTGTAASLAILKDINTGTASYSAISIDVGRIGNILFYQLSDGLSGAELWRTDGTAAGTSLVKDINPGTLPSQPYFGTTIGNKMLFRALSAGMGDELWVTDGTAAGTNLVLDINPGASGSNLQRAVVLNGAAYFSAYTAAAGQELWRSDGTPAGTYMVTDIYAGANDAYPTSLTVMNGRLYFAATSAGAGTELWSSDGTAAGTAMVKDLAAGAASSTPAAITVVNGRLYFAANDAVTGAEVWSSDGTDAGTARVTDLVAGSGSSSPGNFMQIGGMLYFTATTSATGQELFKLNLSTLQASLAADVVPGTAGSSPTQLLRLGGTLCFAATDGSAKNLYTYLEGSGATKRTDFAADGGYGVLSSDSLRIANGALFFSAHDNLHGLELYEFDGSPTSAVQLIDIFPGPYSSGPYGIQPLADSIIFTASTPAEGNELFSLADTSGPRAWQTTFDINTGPRVRVDWTEAVIASASTAQLISLATNQPVPGISLVRTVRADGTGIDYSFSSKLPDGNYRLQFNAADFHDAAGNAGSGTQTFDFFVLAGDINHDRHVDFADLVILAQHYGQTGRTFSEGNLDYDVNGNVDFGDLVILAQRYNASILAAPPAIAATPTKGPGKRGGKDVLE